MYLFLLINVLVLSVSAVPQLPKYQYLEAEYGEISFEIATDTYYPSDWQRVNGDPHGQAAEKEAPDALGDETLSFDFPKTNDNYDVYLWTHNASGLEIIGTVSGKPLQSLDIIHSTFKIEILDGIIIVSNDTYSMTFDYGDSFNVLLHSVTGARLSTTDVLFNIQFEFLDYVFIIIGSNGIYPPVFNVTGNLEQSLSVTMWKGDILEMDALMGQINGYWIYAVLNPKLGDVALAKADINGVLTPPFVVRRSRHLGRYKECWYYGAGTDTHHAIIGKLSDFIVPP